MVSAAQSALTGSSLNSFSPARRPFSTELYRECVGGGSRHDIPSAL
jgi:hypothetical protein